MPKKIKVRSPTPEMIEKRRKDLNYYIRNILIHEEIRKCELVRTFLFEDMTNLSDTEQQSKFHKFFFLLFIVIFFLINFIFRLLRLANNINLYRRW